MLVSSQIRFGFFCVFFIIFNLSLIFFHKTKASRLIFIHLLNINIGDGLPLWITLLPLSLADFQGFLDAVALFQEVKDVGLCQVRQANLLRV